MTAPTLYFFCSCFPPNGVFVCIFTISYFIFCIAVASNTLLVQKKKWYSCYFPHSLPPRFSTRSMFPSVLFSSDGLILPVCPPFIVLFIHSLGHRATDKQPYEQRQAEERQVFRRLVRQEEGLYSRGVYNEFLRLERVQVSVSVAATLLLE